MPVDQEAVVAALVDAVDQGRTEVDVCGETWAIITEPDEYLTPEDVECEESFGKAEYREWRDDRDPRPEWADGRARKIGVDRDGFVWWQPPADMTDRAQVDRMARYVRDVYEYGYTIVGVERVNGWDRFSRPVSGDVNWIGGIGPEVFDADDGQSYLTDIVTDGVAEIMYAEDDTVPAWLTRMVPA